jgi:hypothetical protein
MSATGCTCEHFLIYCHVDGSCSLKQDSTGVGTHHCLDLLDAVALARDLKSCAQLHLTVYDPIGKILLQSIC